MSSSSLARPPFLAFQPQWEKKTQSEMGKTVKRKKEGRNMRTKGFSVSDKSADQETVQKDSILKDLRSLINPSGTSRNVV